MTIQRQYSLPNCSLILEGLGDLAMLSQPEARPLMSVLINAECHLPGQEKPLTGGREFLESLVTTVSQYAQEVISSVHNASRSHHAPSLVQLQRLDDTHHRLSVLPEGAVPGSGIATHLTRNIDLTTVQLFDLIEAVDQFFADSQTLPDLTLNIQPLSRRYVRGGEDMTKQAVPAALGLSGLVLAAIALFPLPAPKITQPTCLKPGDVGCTANPKSPTGSPSASPSPAAGSSPVASPQSAVSPSPTATQPDSDKLAATLSQSPEITSPAELDSLGKTLYSKINDAWKTRTPITRDLVYQVGVSKNGDILGYRPVNDEAGTNAKQTPLLDLLALPRNGSQGNSTPLGQFKVVFTSSGGLEVAPWKQSMASPLNSPLEITDATKIKELQPKLYDQINQNWKTNPSFEKDLVFRVRVKPDGSIADYRPESQDAKDYIEETPLPQLGQAVPMDDNTPAKESMALYKVVFKPNGVLEINPWRGRKD
jgi:hypothetical protein